LFLLSIVEECIKTKEKAKAPQVSLRISPPITGKATTGQTAGNTIRIKKEAASYF
jgi:hypothetical protein